MLDAGSNVNSPLVLVVPASRARAARRSLALIGPPLFIGPPYEQEGVVREDAKADAATIMLNIVYTRSMVLFSCAEKGSRRNRICGL